MEEQLYTPNYYKIFGFIVTITILLNFFIKSKIGDGMKKFILNVGRWFIDLLIEFLFVAVIIAGILLWSEETKGFCIAGIIGGIAIISISSYFLYLIIDINDKLSKLVKLKESENLQPQNEVAENKNTQN